MDEGNKCARQKNPRENASILSIITFFYTLPLFKKGCKKKLDDEDVYNTVPKYLSERLGNKLEAYWHLERKTKESPSVIRVLISCYGRKYLIIGLVEFFAKTAFILQPLILERLLRYFRINETEMYKDDAYIYATLFIGVNLLYTIYNHNYQQYVIEYGIEVRTAFAALMYKKILKLHPSTFSSITMGNIVTLITKDVAAFENAIKCLNDLWVGFLQIIIIAYIISTRMGLSVLSAVGFFIVIIPLEGHYLQPEVAYFVQACYTTLIAYITGSIPYGINQTAELFASARRIQNFLNGKELESQPLKHIAHPKVYLRNVAAEVNGVEVLKDVSLFANKGLLIVTGNVGSGKTVLLKTIMKDYTVSRGQILTEGTISYVSQEPWLFPSALKQNILFGQAYNEKRYQQVLDACALTDDLKQFKYGDRTIVGDRGVNLSKGQQSRINLARAVYRDSDIYLLDDCLSALDTHISQHVFDKCIKGFLRNKIVILVTHNINHIKDNGHNVLFVDDGTTLTIEQQKKTLDKRITYYIDDVDLDYLDGQMKKKERIDEIEDEQERVHYIGYDDEPLLKEKHVEESEENLYHEKKKSGKVSLSVYLQYYRFAGGICALLLVIAVSIISQLALLATDKLLNKWYYLPTGRAIKRLESATRSPMIGYLNATLEGLTTVRAYEKQALLVSQFDKHLDLYTSSYYMMQCTLTAFGFLLDIICNIFTAAVVLWFTTFKSVKTLGMLRPFYGRPFKVDSPTFGGQIRDDRFGKQSANTSTSKESQIGREHGCCPCVKVGDAGLAITQAIKLISFLPRTIKQLSELENNMTSVERALEYTDVDTEDKESGDHKENWPSQGKIEYKEVTLSYQTTEEQVLKKISFILEPGKKLESWGELELENLPLFPLYLGTIKSNIDPADRYSDFQIWEAIEKVNLKQVITSLQEGIVDGGSNYSAGQRQLICLARALVSKCRIIVLDEATASMDSEMCDFIQNTKREIFADCTVITIAHRLSTVADSDKMGQVKTKKTRDQERELLHEMAMLSTAGLLSRLFSIPLERDARRSAAVNRTGKRAPPPGPPRFVGVAKHLLSAGESKTEGI
ncbi:hypothetical protein NQ318_000780 [Aromia moschata]|uniref:Multidrug resistance-associated protein lethal(2)03659 n=1 Tax=Aromia moschata TaxID=1265417 RepID=A0AAV8YSB6_9CUCU|nr:hypothetical protein NQ318_000780 [Aromia moschata]